jgi:hypothetical protein
MASHEEAMSSSVNLLPSFGHSYQGQHVSGSARVHLGDVNNSTSIFSGHNNQGFQVGSNTGNIHINLTGMLCFLYRLTKVKAKSALENPLHHLPYAVLE